MADPNFDAIDAATLESLRKEVVFDDFFKDNSFQAKLRQGAFLDRIEDGWQRIFARRAIAMGVKEDRVLEVLAEMRKTRGGAEPQPGPVYKFKFEGGSKMSEPIVPDWEGG